MYPTHVDVVLALEKARDAWKEVFFVPGYGRSFDKYSVNPEPAAMAILAGLILIAEVQNGDCKTDSEGRGGKEKTNGS